MIKLEHNVDRFIVQTRGDYSAEWNAFIYSSTSEHAPSSQSRYEVKPKTALEEELEQMSSYSTLAARQYKQKGFVINRGCFKFHSGFFFRGDLDEDPSIEFYESSNQKWEDRVSSIRIIGIDLTR